MDSTLVQIINEWLALQAVAQRLEQENTQLKAQVAELQKPKTEVIETPLAPPIGESHNQWRNRIVAAGDTTLPASRDSA